MNRNIVGLIVLAASLTGMRSAADTHYVSPTGNDTNSPYLSWETAARNISKAVNAASDGDVVLVADGTYPVSGSTLIVINKNITVQSLNGASKTTVDGQKKYRCFFVGKTNAVVDGFKMINGMTAYHGGGAFLSCGTIRNCLITGNMATNSNGGGIYAPNSIPGACRIYSCNISDNTATTNGGGVYLGKGGIMDNCGMSRNKAIKRYGGGAFLSASQAINCDFSNNTAKCGGGADLEKGSLATNCFFFANEANEGGGAFLYSTSVVVNCTFKRNQGFYNGGGVKLHTSRALLCEFNQNKSGAGGGACLPYQAVVDNSLFVSNEAPSGGGAYMENWSELNNCLIFGNSAQYGGAIQADGENQIFNCTMAGNRAAYQYEAIDSPIGMFVANSILSVSTNDNFNSHITYSHCCVLNALPPGDGNIQADPLYADAAHGNYRLQAASPCIDQGGSRYVIPGDTDLDGNPRISGTSVDMGAFEFR